jgi:hypothetical protein
MASRKGVSFPHRLLRDCERVVDGGRDGGAVFQIFLGEQRGDQLRGLGTKPRDFGVDVAVLCETKTPFLFSFCSICREPVLVGDCVSRKTEQRKECCI